MFCSVVDIVVIISSQVMSRCRRYTESFFELRYVKYNVGVMGGLSHNKHHNSTSVIQTDEMTNTLECGGEFETLAS